MNHYPEGSNVGMGMVPCRKNCTCSDCTIDRLSREITKKDRRIAELEVGNRTQAINIVMEQPPNPESQFVEVELDNGAGIKIGEWVEYGDFWALRIESLPEQP